ncbi:MAG: DNA translocase FtsK [Clostridia bacterium]|nr:DNA translocase FtsK [Clostridia bacterium]
MGGLGRNVKKEKKENKEKSQIFTAETLGVVICLFATLCLVCLITGNALFADIGRAVQVFLLGVFGVFAYAVLLYLLVLGVCLITGKKTGTNLKQKIIITLFFLSITLLGQAITMRDYSALSYGEYLSTCYTIAEGGIKTSSMGGIIVGLVSYGVTALVKNVGAYVIFAITTLVAGAFIVLECVKVFGKKEFGKKKAVQVEGERDYPVADLDFNGGNVGNISTPETISQNQEGISSSIPNATQGIQYATGGNMQAQTATANNNFNENSAQDSYQGPIYSQMQGDTFSARNGLGGMANGTQKGGVQNNGANLNFENGESAENLTENYSTTSSYTDTQGWSLQEKIDYILKPMTYDEMNKYPTSSTRVSNYVNPRDARANAQNEESTPSVPPLYEHNQVEDAPTTSGTGYQPSTRSGLDYFDLDGAIQQPEEPVIEDAATHAEQFANKYALSEDFGDNEYFTTDESTEIGADTDEPQEVSFRPVESTGFGGRVGFGSATPIAESSNVEDISNDTFNDNGASDITSTRDISSTRDVNSPRDITTPRTEFTSRRGDILSNLNDTDNGKSETESKPSVFDDSADSLFKKDTNGTDFLSSRRRTDFTSRVEADNNSSSASNLTPAPEPIKEEKPKPIIKKPYVRPPLDLLETYVAPADAPSEDHEGRQQAIKDKLEEFHISVEPQSFVHGPSVTRYEVKMPAGISVKKILGYDDDLKATLKSRHGIRIEAPIPGKDLVGIEVPNKYKTTVGLREIMQQAASMPAKPGSLIFALGKDIVGNCITHNLAKGPHYLVAGATGSGKSVCLNVMIISLIMRYSPEELRFILVDPKSVGFGIYKHIPHLLIDEIITEAPRTLAALQWLYTEMERRYKLFEESEGLISDLDAYNARVAKDGEKLPRIVVVVDELADLMENYKKDMEQRIQALVQKSRAAGIHLVLATQRPSVNIITGTIKANLPTRIALKVMNFTDSQTILSEAGAEKLLGNGDMLFRDSGMPESERYQGAWLSDAEIVNVVSFIKENNPSYYSDELTSFLDRSVKPAQDDRSTDALGNGGSSGGEEGGQDDLFLRALWLGVTSKSISISQLIRRFQIGYGKAGGLVDKMERMGFVSPSEGSKPRKVLISREEYEEKFGGPPANM